MISSGVAMGRQLRITVTMPERNLIFFKNLFIFIIFGRVGSLLLRAGFL